MRVCATGANGPSFGVADDVWVHGFVTLEGKKLSKSAGVVLPFDDAIGRYGVDAFRYYVLREIPFDGDGDFSWKRFAEVYDSELANTLGNLASRTIAWWRSIARASCPTHRRSTLPRR